MSGRSDVARRSSASAAGGGAGLPPRADVVIAGASFAGLAAAREIAGRASRSSGGAVASGRARGADAVHSGSAGSAGAPSTVLIDPVPVGDGQTSACGAPASVIQALGAAASIQQRHDVVVLHFPGREVRWRLPEPFCTFDYRRCCLDALAGLDASVVRASVLDRRGMVVVTSRGEIEARILLDCTGWRAALSTGRGNGVDAARVGGRAARPVPAGQQGIRYFGLEAEVPSAFPPGLHFYFGGEIAGDGYGWAFPAGAVTRVGVLSYRGATRLGAALGAFLHRLGMPPGPLHGGFLDAGFRSPVVDGVFVAGDAGGQCLPLTGEGIRTAVWAGRAAGRWIRMALDGRLSLEEARERYRAYTARQRRGYRALGWATRGIGVLPWRLFGLAASWMSHPVPLQAFMRRYLGLFSRPPGGAWDDPPPVPPSAPLRGRAPAWDTSGNRATPWPPSSV